MKSTNDLNFYKKLKDNKSSSIQEQLTKFINEDFDSMANLEKIEIGKNIQEFISKLIIEFSRLWKLNLLNNPSHYMEICDAFEGIITKALYNRIFCSTKKEKEEDYHFEKLVKKFNFITPKHLDIDDSIIDWVYIEVAINKLSMINHFKAPKDKGIILINFCNILTSMLTDNVNKSTKIAGADEVFPLVVYVILKGNIQKLKSNLNYIQLFRHETRLESQEEYYFTTINSALEFIENSNHNKLNIKESDFIKYCKEAEKRETERMKERVIPWKSIIYLIDCYNIVGNSDENYLIFQLTNGNKNDESLNKNYIEMSDMNHNILINTDSTVKKSLNSNSMGLLSVDLEKLYKEYFNNNELSDFTIMKIEKLYNDFKIILRLIDSFKMGYYRNQKDNFINGNN